MIKAGDLAQFVKNHNWIVIDQSDEEEEKLGNRYVRYLTPQGNAVLVRKNKDGSIERIVV